MRRNGWTITAAAALALALAGAAVAGVVMHRSAHGSRIVVALREYRITLKGTAAAGKTTFAVTNRGKIAHSFAISGPGTAKKRIAGTIAPGQTKTLTVTLAAGTYTVWCPVPGHAALGMKATLHVTGSSVSGTAGTTTSGGNGGSWG
jgi:plastocyanin